MQHNDIWLRSPSYCCCCCCCCRRSEEFAESLYDR